MNELIANLSWQSILGPVLYLDPGSGSAIFQLVIAGILGAGVVIRLYWKRINAFFSKDQPEDAPGADDEQ